MSCMMTVLMCLVLFKCVSDVQDCSKTYLHVAKQAFAGFARVGCSKLPYNAIFLHGRSTFSSCRACRLLETVVERTFFYVAEHLCVSDFESCCKTQIAICCMTTLTHWVSDAQKCSNKQNRGCPSQAWQIIYASERPFFELVGRLKHSVQNPFCVWWGWWCFCVGVGVVVF